MRRWVVIALLVGLLAVVTATSATAGAGRKPPGTRPKPTSTTTSTTTAPTTTTTTAPIPSRDLTVWPFASTSPWNLPIGTGATFASSADPRTVSLLLPSATPWINAGQYSHPIYRATDADPMATVSRPGYPTESYRIPASATPAAGTDQHLHVVEPNGRWLHETWNTTGTSPTYATGYHVLTDLTGPGMGQGGVRAYGGSAIGGLIRRWDLDEGAIRHALALAITGNQLQSGYVWPATAQDGNAASTYFGSLPMGSYVAIPPTVDVEVLPISSAGKVLARALQTYGAYVVDRAGAFTFFAEPTLSGDARVTAMRNDLAAIRATLGVVTNNSASNVNGGGVRRAPLAP
jgi:hypothetical protein